MNKSNTARETIEPGEILVTDLLLASTLLYFKVIPLRIESEPGSSRSIFIFKSSPEIEKIRLDFISDKVLVAPRNFFGIMRNVKAICKEQRGNNDKL
jgi:hypothetical protein